MTIDGRWIVGRQWRIMRRWLPAVVLATVLVAAPVYAFLSAQAAVYQASATLRVGGTSGRLPDYNSILASAEISRYYAFLVTQRPLLTGVIERLDLPMSVEQLARRVSASTGVNGSVLTVAVLDNDPESARAIADAIAEEMIEHSPGNTSNPAAESLQNDLAALRADIDATQAEIARIDGSQRQADLTRLSTLRTRLLTLVTTHADILELAAGSDTNRLELVVPAIAPLEPVEPRPLFFTALAALVALIGATAVVFLLEYVKNDVKDADDIEAVTGVPVVGKVTQPRGALRVWHPSSIVAMYRPESKEAESYRKLRVNIDLLAAHGEFRSLLVTGPRPVDGKALTAANLAVAFAQSGRRVILVDADLRDPHVHGLFQLSNERGLTHVLEHGVEIVDHLALATPEPNLRIIAAGSARVNPTDLMGSQRMRDTVLRLLSLADLVIFDSPPVPDYSDAVLLSSIVQETVLVVSPRRVSRDSALQARQSLEMANANLLGVVAFEVSRSIRWPIRVPTKSIPGRGRQLQPKPVKASDPQRTDPR